RPPLLSGRSVLPSLKLITDCYARRPLPVAEPWVDEGLKREPGANGTPSGVHVGTGPTRRVLITGATGFVGGRLAEVLALRGGWRARALAPPPGRPRRPARPAGGGVCGRLGGPDRGGAFCGGLRRGGNLPQRNFGGHPPRDL